MTKNQIPETSAALTDIAALCEKHHVSGVIFAGVCAMRSWSPRKAVSEEDFLAAVAAFIGAATRDKGGKNTC